MKYPLSSTYYNNKAVTTITVNISNPAQHVNNILSTCCISLITTTTIMMMMMLEHLTKME